MTRDDDPESRPRKESGMRGYVLAGLNPVGCSFQTCLDFISKNFHLDRAGPDRHEVDAPAQHHRASGYVSRCAGARERSFPYSDQGLERSLQANNLVPTVGRACLSL